MLVLRHLGLAVRELVVYVLHTGKWWLPVLIVVLAVTATVVTAAKVVVPTVVYTLF
ncbi:MAG: hypothetical protein JWM47_2021 [Acidimicrobiales bacterium]|nr:hypothetical protein [Acidimicrobiales bacterium]